MARGVVRAWSFNLISYENCNEKNGPGKKWPARAIFFCKNWAPLAKIGPGTSSFSMEPESDMAGVVLTEKA